MKRYLMLFLLNIYLIQLCCFFILDDATWAKALMILLLASAAVLMILNIAGAVRGIKTMPGSKEQQLALNRTVLAFKVLTIPFYFLHFIIFTLATSVTVMLPMLRYLVLFLPVFGMLLSYLVLLTGSVPAIALLVVLHRDGLVSRNKMIWHIILQLLFILDVIDYLILSSGVRRLLLYGEAGAPDHAVDMERSQPLGKYGYGAVAGIWIVVGYMVLLSNKIPLLDSSAARWIWALVIVGVCGFILSMAIRVNRNMLITLGISVLGWFALILTELGSVLNHGFGNTGGYLPGQAAYLFGGVLLIPILLFSYFAARLIPRFWKRQNPER